MKHKKIIGLLVLCIIILSLAASFIGIFSGNGQGKYNFISVHGKNITVYGKGLYQHDSVSLAAQAKAQDSVTLVFGIPLLAISLYLSGKKLLKGKLLLAGALGYFLYTYMSYTFLMMYNPFFLIYVIIMSASFFGFLIVLMSFDIDELSSYFRPELPARFIGIFLISFGIIIGLMWLGTIVPPLIRGTVPPELDHYTTLTIQAMDIGFVIPAIIISAALLIRRKSLGYLLASVLIIKVIAMLIAVTAMAIGMIMAGVKVDLIQTLVFPFFGLLAVYCLTLIIKNVSEFKIVNQSIQSANIVHSIKNQAK